MIESKQYIYNIYIRFQLIDLSLTNICEDDFALQCIAIYGCKLEYKLNF